MLTGWPIVVLLVLMILVPPILLRLWWWAGMLGAFAIVFAATEALAYKFTGMTISNQFGELYAEHPAYGIASLIFTSIGYVLLMIHLVAEGVKRRREP